MIVVNLANSLILSLVNNMDAYSMYDNPVQLAKQIQDIFNAKFKGQQREANVNPLQINPMGFPGPFPGMPGPSFLG